MAFLEEIAARLQAQGVGTVNVNIFASSKAQIPAGPGPYLTLTDTGGSAPTRRQNQSASATQRPTAQILGRGQSYTSTIAMVRAAYVALDGIFNQLLSGTFYVSVMARQEPTDLGQLDGAGRVQIAFNIDVEKYVS